MDLFKMLGSNVNLEEIEKRALEAKVTQEAMLSEMRVLVGELRDLNRKISVIVFAAEKMMADK